ncbi:MAG TPA: substrate-binding domain-containing protein [Caldilineaceae bacterium]|nr:substrate-binding domain-containing protein [Caldilineaceae bacterium]
MKDNLLSRRTFLQGAAASGLGLTLAGCAAPAQPPAGGEQSDEATPATDVVTIRFMSRAGPDNNPNAQRVLDEDFSSEHSNIKVQLEPAPDDFEQKLLAQMIAGDANDIFEAWGNIFYNWLQRDLLLDVQPYVDRDLSDEAIADYNEFQWTGLVMRGPNGDVRVGMPKYINIMTITYNKDLFDKYGVDYPPADGNWDHDDYANMAKQLTEAAAAAGDTGRIGGWLPAWSWDRFWNHVYMFGGRVVNEKYGTECMLGSPESQAGLKWMYDMIWTYNWFARPDQVENQWGDNALAPGFVCFIEDGTYPLNRDRILGEVMKWDMAHVPVGPTGERTVLGTTDAWSIWKGTSHPDEAWEVLKFMSGPIYQDKQIVRQEGIIPVLKSAIASFIDTVREVNPNLIDVRLETIQEVLDWGYAQDTFWFADQNAAAELLIPALEKVFTVGDVGPEYFIEVCDQVTAAQTA